MERSEWHLLKCSYLFLDVPEWKNEVYVSIVAMLFVYGSVLLVFLAEYELFHGV